MSTTNTTKEKTTSKLNMLVVYFVFALLSLLFFYGKAEFYSFLPEIIEVAEVLFGESIATTFQGNDLMPNNNQTAYFVSNYTIKSPQSTYYQSTIRLSNTSYTYSTISNITNSRPDVVLVDNLFFEQKNTIKKPNQEGIANSYNYGYDNFKIFDRFTPFQSNLASAQITGNETTSTLFNTSNNDPLRVSQTDPDPAEPEGSVLPLGNDLAILLLLAGVYAFLKFGLSKSAV